MIAKYTIMLSLKQRSESRETREEKEQNKGSKQEEKKKRVGENLHKTEGIIGLLYTLL